jgi:NDMA-dependent alcohol dehydrogenase
VLWEQGGPWKIEEIELDKPRPDEVLVRLAASGLCHTDDHLVTGDLPAPFPVVGGHEAAGVVIEIGSEVTRVAVGDHVILASVPSCGKCRWCAAGRSDLCDDGAYALTGRRPDGTYNRHQGTTEIGAFCQIGTFSEYVVAPETQTITIDKDIPLELAALIGCGVTTGFGAAARVGEVQPGDVVMVVCIGSFGINAVQGAKLAGAGVILAVDQFESKRQWALDFGAHHFVTSVSEAHQLVSDLTLNVMADKVILAVGVSHGDMIGPLLDLVSKGGRVLLSSFAPIAEQGMSGSLLSFTMGNKQLVGHIYGESNQIADIPRVMVLYRNGSLKLAELITNRYPLEQINEGFEAMLRGENLRGVIVYDQ